MTEQLTAPVRVSVVIPSYRRPDRLQAVVAALEAQTMPPAAFEVLIVDNGSGDETPEVLAGLAGRSPLRLRLLSIEQNAGPAGARNFGWRSAVAPYVAFTDDDCVPDPEWLARGVAALDAHPAVGVVQGCTLPPDEPYERTEWTAYRRITSFSPFFEGCNLFFRREALEAGGGFDESILFGGEDTVAGWSAVEAGYEKLFEHQAVVRHPYEERGLKWHIVMAWRERNLVGVAARHPAFSAGGLWRPWAMHRYDLPFVWLLAGIALARRMPFLGLVLALPWLRLRALRPGGFAGPRSLASWFVLDTVRLAGLVSAGVRHRRLIL